MSEVLRYTTTARVAKSVLAERWVPPTHKDVLERAPAVDRAYEEAVGLHKEHAPELRPILEGQLPSVDVRCAVTRGLLELERVLRHVSYLDFGLWWHVIAADLAYEPPSRVRLRGAHKLPLPYKPKGIAC